MARNHFVKGWDGLDALMKCPTCKGEKTVLFMGKLESCYVCKGTGAIEIPEERLEEYFSRYREKKDED